MDHIAGRGPRTADLDGRSIYLVSSEVRAGRLPPVVAGASDAANIGACVVARESALSVKFEGAALLAS
jgi:hypothetical protein